MVPNIVQGSYRKILSKFTTFLNIMWKSTMKVCNSSAHPVKGRNPYCSGWPTHSISQN